VDKETLKYVLRQSFEAGPPPTRPRALELPLKSNKVILVRGIRRSGKTSLFYHTMRRLEAEGVARQRILYLNLEDDRLYPIHASELELVLQAQAELFPEYQTGPRYLFLDEIQAVEGWERFVRRVHDTERVGLFITGSAPHLLSRHLAPVLRGRSISYELLPLDFSEALAFREIRVEPYSAANQAVVAKALIDYLRWGGFPEILLAEEPLRRKIITEYADLLYYRDLVDQFSVRNESAMRLLLKHCLSQPATLVSAHKLFHDFQSQGLTISKNTIYDYLRFLQEAGLIFAVPKHAQSLRQQEQNPKKIFLVDLGLMQAFTAQPDRDLGRKLENLVFLKQRSRGGDLFYQADGPEVDLVRRAESELIFTNVCWAMETLETRRREVAGLVRAHARFPHARLELVAHDFGGHSVPRPIKKSLAAPYLLA
jgi:hypothetical protein